MIAMVISYNDKEIGGLSSSAKSCHHNQKTKEKKSGDHGAEHERNYKTRRVLTVTNENYIRILTLAMTVRG